MADASRRLCARVKNVDPRWLAAYAGCVLETSRRDRRLAALFAPEAVLVPVPGSTPRRQTPWAALQLALALNALGLGLGVWTGLRRESAVRKSATAPRAARPSVRQHYESISVARPMIPIHRVVLIDDVVTRGRTLLAAAARMTTVLPRADIRGFALIRTLGFVDRLDHLVDSCHGVVRWAGGDARREP